MSDNSVVWEEPRKLGGGASLRRPPKWYPILEPLMQHPKRWAVVERTDVPERASNMASYLRRPGTYIPPGRWQFTSRTDANSGAVYARYLGPEDDARD